MSKIKAATIREIVTHPGKAHRDEFLAVGIVLAVLPTQVSRKVTLARREPTAADTLADGVLVLDIGGGDFDHHQLARTAPACCALTLVLKDLGLLETAYQAWPWLGFTEVLDSKGPSVAAESVGATWPKSLPMLLSPVEQWALHWFEQGHNDCLDVPRGIGAFLLQELQDYAAAEVALAKHAKVRTVAGLEVIDLSFTTELTAVPAWKARHAPHAVVSILKDDRGDGLALYRYNDDSRVDFSRLQDVAAVKFAHKGGFIAKTHEVLPEKVVDALIFEALTKRVSMVQNTAFAGGRVETSWVATPQDREGQAAHYVTRLQFGITGPAQSFWDLTHAIALQRHNQVVNAAQSAIADLGPDGSPTPIAELEVRL